MSTSLRPSVIRGGRVIDPSQGFDGIADVVLIDGSVASVEATKVTDLPHEWLEFDATGKIVCPGFIDLHTHLRSPGEEWKEDPSTASEAAARGGFTTICAMPNTYPAQDSESVVEALLRRCAVESKVRVRAIGAITKGRKGAELAPMHELAEAGVVGFSDDGDPVMSSHLMRQALAYASDLGLPIINHAEDKGLVSAWDMNEGMVSTHLGLRGIPNSAESVMIARDVELARITGGRLHVPHVSTSEAVGIIQSAKAEGISVTAEVTPHHLALTEEWVYGDRGAVPKVLQSHSYDTHAKMAPPLRTEGDRQALKDALKDGTIDVIGTDHAPHAATDKVCTFTEASNGIIGLETALALVCDLGDVDVKLAIERLTAGPSEILRDSSIGNLKRGANADIAIIDPDEEWSVDDYTIGSKSRNTPLLGMKLSGRVIATFVGGEMVWDAEENGAVDV